ncbi:MAG: galactokinase [Lachnospiraceae bacterium]|nr:galactokinase [Lachnospiraceae bacterium]
MEDEITFSKVFGEGGEIRKYFAPGRVNLIGEHTDYNGGHVFPCALSIGTYAAVRKRTDRKLRFYSVNFPDAGILETSLDDKAFRRELDWTNYPRGVVWAAEEAGYKADCGFDVLFRGTIPNSSGLSSSASIEVLTGYFLADLYGFDYDGIVNAKLGQRAENAFIGVNCGIMDQFAIAMGQKGHAIFLNTGTLAYEYAPLDLKGVRIVIMNTNKKRGLGDSKYNERRAECEKALQYVQQTFPVQALCELTKEQWAVAKETIPSVTLRKRAEHAVTENLRTLAAYEALKKGDLTAFGRLMNESHISLKEDYEVTGRELDTLVEAAWQQAGVLGARMTGAGFGGCAVSLVQEDAVSSFVTNVGQIYREQIGYDATFYEAETGSGPVRIG